MTNYYKGDLFLTSDISYPIRIVYLYQNAFLGFSNSVFLKEYQLLNNNDQSIVISSFLNEKQECTEILKKIFKDKISIDNKRLSIIYEIICDEDDNLYAKELLTGAILPIIGKKIIEYNIINKGKHRFISDCDNIHGKYLEVEPLVFQNNKGEMLNVNEYKIEDDYFYPYYGKDSSYQSALKFRKYEAKEYAIEPKFKYEFSNLQRGECFVLNLGIANEPEIEEYKRKYQNEKKPLFKRRYKSFQDKVRDYAKLNVFDREIIPKKEEVKERKSVNELGKLMDDIEYLLLKLKNHSDTFFNKYKQVYEELCNSNGLKHGTLDKNTLESLKANILLSLEFDGNKGMNILDYLEDMKNEYLKNIFKKEDKKTKITIQDLDRIMELYLQTQDEYDLVIQRQIIRNISLLYLFELYENKDNLDDFDLYNSYIKEVLKTILVCIDKLREEGLLEKNILVDLSSPTLDNIIELIQNIEFNRKDKDKVKELIV